MVNELRKAAEQALTVLADIDQAEKHEPAFWLNEQGQLSATRGMQSVILLIKN